MYQLICGLALATMTIGTAQANLIFVKEDGSKTALVVPEDQTAAVYKGEDKILAGRTVLDQENAKEPNRNGIRILPDDGSTCPAFSLSFTRETATLTALGTEGATVEGASPCAVAAIEGRYQLLRDQKDPK